MKTEAIVYIFFLVISLFVSFMYGRNRNIGITWSIIFSIFCSIGSVPIILFSKKKDFNNPPTNRYKWGILGFILLFLKLSGEGSELNIAKSFYETIGMLTLPYSVFVDNISSEEVGYFSTNNLFFLLPFYFILRNYTLKYLP